jgi:hypothetical protein
MTTERDPSLAGWLIMRPSEGGGNRPLYPSVTGQEWTDQAGLQHAAYTTEEIARTAADCLASLERDYWRRRPWDTPYYYFQRLSISFWDGSYQSRPGSLSSLG